MMNIKDIIDSVTVENAVTLVTVYNLPNNSDSIADIFSCLAEKGINVDMISLNPAQSSRTSLSFTISDDDLVKTLSYTSKLNDGKIKPIVSSGNCKISVNDAGMENCPGVAAKVFGKAASVKTDILLITTSEAQISLLVTKSDFDSAYTAIQEAFE